MLLRLRHTQCQHVCAGPFVHAVESEVVALAGAIDDAFIGIQPQHYLVLVIAMLGLRSQANAAVFNRFHGTLADLPSLEARVDLTGPVMTIIGDAVAGANFERSEPLATHRHEGASIAAAQGVEQ